MTLVLTFPAPTILGERQSISRMDPFSYPFACLFHSRFQPSPNQNVLVRATTGDIISRGREQAVGRVEIGVGGDEITASSVSLSA